MKGKLRRACTIFVLFIVTWSILTFPLITHPFSSLLAPDEPINEDTIFKIWFPWYVSTYFTRMLIKPSLFRYVDIYYHPWGTDLYLSSPCFYHAGLPAAVTRLKGFPADGNFHFLATMTGNACAAYLALRILGVNAIPATLGGAALLLNPYSIDTFVEGRDEQSNAWFVLVGIAFMYLLIRHGGRKQTVQTAIVILLAGLFYWFHALFLLLFLIMLTLYQSFYEPRGRKLLPTKRALALLIILLTLVLPFIYPFLHQTFTVGKYQGLTPDSLVPLTFTPKTTGNEFAGELSLESPGLYQALGGPIAVVEIFIILSLFPLVKKRSRALFWTITAALFLVLALGPVWKLGGVSIPLPFALLYAFVPFVSRLMDTARLAVMVHVFLACALAELVDTLFRERQLSRLLKLSITGGVWVLLLTVAFVSRRHEVISAPRIPVAIEQMAELSAGSVIDIPLLSNQVASNALWFQTMHGRKLLIGPGVALGFVRPASFERFYHENSLLSFFSSFPRKNELPDDTIDPAHISELIDMGFKYVIHHRRQSAISGNSKDNEKKTLFKASQKLRKIFSKPVIVCKEVEIYDLKNAVEH